MAGKDLWREEIEPEAAVFKNLWASYYYSARRVEELERELWSNLMKKVLEANEQHDRALGAWTDAVLHRDSRSVFDKPDIDLFALGNPHPKLGTLNSSITGKETEIFLRFPRPPHIPYAYSSSAGGPPPQPIKKRKRGSHNLSVPYTVPSRAFYTPFPLSPYNILAFASLNLGRLASSQLQQVRAIILGWVWCRCWSRRAFDDEDSFGAHQGELVSEVDLLLLEGVPVKVEGGAKWLRPPLPLILEFANDDEFVAQEAQMLYQMEQFVMDYSERFFRHTAKTWVRTARPFAFDLVAHDELSEKDELFMSGNSLSEFHAREDVRENLRLLLEPKLRLLTPTERRYFLMHKAEERSYSEIASEMGVSFENVKQTLAKAHKRLRGELPPGRNYHREKKF